jgi:hypothetical protein
VAALPTLIWGLRVKRREGVGILFWVFGERGGARSHA